MRAPVLVLTLALCLGLVPPAAASAAARGLQGVSACADLVTPDRTLAQDVMGLNPAGDLGNPELCLLAYPAADVYKAVIVSLDSADQFATAKQDALAQLTGLAVDLCKVNTWQAEGAQSIPLSLDQQQNLPLECPPRIQAADAGAQPLLPDVRTAFGQIIDSTAAQTGWRPNRTLVVKVFSDPSVAVPTINQYMLQTLTGETVDSLTQRTRNGGSWHKLNDPVLGNLILLNLTQLTSQSVGGIKFSVAFNYTGFANGGISGNADDDAWFRQGLDSYQAERNGGQARGYLDLAARTQKAATEVTPLGDLSSLEQFLAHQRSETAPLVQARAHAAFVYLVERYGFDALLQLVRQNRDATRADFDNSLNALTGTDQSGLDDAFSAWLGGVSRPTGKGGANFHVDVTASPGTTYAEFVIKFDRGVPCGTSRQVTAGTSLTLSTPVPAGGQFTASNYLGDATITLQGTLAGSSVNGTARFNNPRTGCDTSALAFN